MNKRTCWYCERVIAVNPLTDNLRYHNWPKGKEPVFAWIIPGKECPGVGSGGK